MILPITGFEPQISNIGSDRSTNCPNNHDNVKTNFWANVIFCTICLLRLPSFAETFSETQFLD